MEVNLKLLFVEVGSQDACERCKPRRAFQRETPLGAAALDHTVPYGTVRSPGGFPWHFVPGYDRIVPTGRSPFGAWHEGP